MTNNLYRFPLAYTQTPVGPFIYMPMDEYVGQSLDKYGWYSPSECKFLQMLTQPGWRVANIGAQMGYVARALAITGATVDAFEPQPGMYDVLKANSRLGEGRINVTNVAVGKEYKDINVPHFNYGMPANFGAIGSSHWTSGNTICQLKLDEMMEQHYDLIQIDAEGMEQEILEGGKELIARTRPVLFLENDKASTGTELIKYVHSIGYRCYWLRTPLFEYPNPADNNENIFGNTTAMNMVCFSAEGNPTEDWCKANLQVVKESDPIGVAENWVILS